MTRTLLAALSAASLLLAGTAAQADVIGTWLRESGASHVKFAPCGGGAICGHLTWLKPGVKTKAKVGQRVVMLHPVGRLRPNEPQIIFDGDSAELLICSDPRVQQFVRGEAKSRVDLGGPSSADW